MSKELTTEERIANLESSIDKVLKAVSAVTNTNNGSEDWIDDPEKAVADELNYMSLSAVQGRRTQRQLQRLSEIGILEKAVDGGSTYQKRYAMNQLRWMAR
jgi:nitric oxide reductase activation protein